MTARLAHTARPPFLRDAVSEPSLWSTQILTCTLSRWCSSLSRVPICASHPPLTIRTASSFHLGRFAPCSGNSAWQTSSLSLSLSRGRPRDISHTHTLYITHGEASVSLYRTRCDLPLCNIAQARRNNSRKQKRGTVATSSRSVHGRSWASVQRPQSAASPGRAADRYYGLGLRRAGRQEPTRSDCWRSV